MFTKISCFFMTFLLLASSSFAQMPDLSKFGLNKTVPAASGMDLTKLTAAKDQIINTYTQSTQTMDGSLGKILTALGGNSDLLGKLSPNPTSSSLQPIIEAIKQKLQGTQNLTPDSQKSLETGLSSFVGGFSSLKGLVPSLGSLSQQAQGTLTTAPLQDKFKVQGILSQIMPLAQTIPANLNTYKSILSSLLSFASSHNIHVPAMAQGLVQ